MKLLLKTITIASTFIAGPVLAADWTLNSDASHLAYGTIKIDDIGEVNSFTNLSGHVREDGKVDIDIDLSSVETNVDIRNERMFEHVFRKAPAATLTAEIDMDAVSKLDVGASTTVEVDATLSLVGADVEFYTDIEPPRVYRRLFCSRLRRLYQGCSGLHRMRPPVLVAAGARSRRAAACCCTS